MVILRTRWYSAVQWRLFCYKFLASRVTTPARFCSSIPSPIQIHGLDHLVLTVRSVPDSLAFYSRVLGMEVVTFQGNRKALRFGSHKLNLHQAGQEVEPKALRPTPGSVDLCLVTHTPLPAVTRHLQGCGVTVEQGPVMRTGAVGPITSVYFRDPDGNLIEVSNYDRRAGDATGKQ
nr:PREDICTED: glyoxalase domain-containing protein 5 [Lepisosteus oculatus]